MFFFFFQFLENRAIISCNLWTIEQLPRLLLVLKWFFAISGQERNSLNILTSEMVFVALFGQ